MIRDLRARDERDRNRADSPLKPAPDAVLLDSTNMTLEEAVAAAEAIVDGKDWSGEAGVTDAPVRAAYPHATTEML